MIGAIHELNGFISRMNLYGVTGQIVGVNYIPKQSQNG